MPRRLPLLLTALVCGAALRAGVSPQIPPGQSGPLMPSIPRGSVVTLAAQAVPAGAKARAEVSVSGTGFPAGAITGGDMIVHLAPATDKDRPSGDVAATAVTPASGGSRTVRLTVPDWAVPYSVPYLVSIAGTAADGTPFSSGNSAALTILPRVVVSPNPAVLHQGESQQFTADEPVERWDMWPATGVGTITRSGLYTAPAKAVQRGTAEVFAHSQANTTIYAATASVIVMPGVTVLPGSVPLYPGQTQQFTADKPVRWSLSPAGAGKIDANGLYTAPEVAHKEQWVMVTATSRDDPARSGNAGVNVLWVLTVRPWGATTLSAGQRQQFTASQSVTWKVLQAGAGTIDANGLYRAPAKIPYYQDVEIVATSTQDATKSASTGVRLIADLRVTPASATLFSGQVEQFAGYRNVAWSLDPPGLGTIGDSGIYTPPDRIATKQTVTVIATSLADQGSNCALPPRQPGAPPTAEAVPPREANPRETATATITLMPPVSVEPREASLYAGHNRQFSANQSVKWTISPDTGVGTIDSTGLYTAPARVMTGEKVTITATSPLNDYQRATATVTLIPPPPPVSVFVYPRTGKLFPGQTEQFAARVRNASDTAVQWSISPSGVGTIDSTGLYTAPAAIEVPRTVTVKATTREYPPMSDTVSLTLNPPPPAITSAAPAMAPVGVTQTVTITGARTGFLQGQTQVSFGPGVTVTDIQVLSPTELTASILPASTAAPGPVGLTVTTGETKATLAGALTITGAPLTIVSPVNLGFVNTPGITVSGRVGDPAAMVTVNGAETANASGNFTAAVPLFEGANTVLVSARSAGGATSVAAIRANLDTTPPHLAIVSPPAGMRTAEASVTVAGTANEIVAGAVDGREAQVTVNGVASTVSSRSFSAVVPLAPGRNAIRVVARDRVGNTAAKLVKVTRVAASRLHIVSGDNQSGLVQRTLAQPLVVRILGRNGLPARNQTVVFRVAQSNGMLSAVAASGPGQTSVQVLSDASGQAQAYWTLGSHAGAGYDRVDVTFPGHVGRVYFSAIGVPSAPAGMVVVSGLNQTGAAGGALPLPFIASVVDAVGNGLAGVAVTFTVTGGGGRLLGASAADPVTVLTDSNGRAAALLKLGTVLGQGNQVVMATFDGNPGAPAVFAASAIEAGAFPAQSTARSSVTGVVRDDSGAPIPGVTVRALALSPGTGSNLPQEVPAVRTNSRGRFKIAPAPAGAFKLMADGTTATVAGKRYPALEFDVTTVPGRAMILGVPIHLPELDPAGQLCVTAARGGTLRLPAAPGFSLTVAPGSATFPGGSHSGCISAAPVDVDKLPMTDGPGHPPRFLVTIQPLGTTFNPPAALTLPNVGGLEPRQIAEMYSYDHELAAFTAIGTGTVNAGGSVIASDPGAGVRKAGWHGGGDPAVRGTAPACEECNIFGETACVADPRVNHALCQFPDGSRGVCGNGVCGSGLSIVSVTSQAPASVGQEAPVPVGEDTVVMYKIAGDDMFDYVALRVLNRDGTVVFYDAGWSVRPGTHRAVWTQTAWNQPPHCGAFANPANGPYDIQVVGVSDGVEALLPWSPVQK